VSEPEQRPGIDGVDVFGRSYDWPPERSAGGQCMDCGFLSRRSIDPSRQAVEEVTIEDRKSGQLFQLTTGQKSIPWCFVRPSSEVDLQREVESVAADARQRARDSGTPDFVQVSLPEIDVMAVLVNDRKCPEWYWYTPTLSPADHRSERNVLRMKETERQQAEDSRKIAEALKDIAAQTRELQLQTLRITDETGRFTSRWTLAAALLAVVSLLLVVASYLFPDLGPAIGTAIDRALGYPLGTAAPR
jgi:hypothetical protein